MGIQCSKKCQSDKVDSALTAEHIGEPNRKRATNNDPYGAGKQFDKRAKPDAHSATANTRAYMSEMRKTEPLPTIINTGTPVDVRCPCSNIIMCMGMPTENITMWTGVPGPGEL